jgi:hypothetical protein
MPKTTTSSTFSPSQKAFMREGMLQAFYRQLAENTRRATAASPVGGGARRNEAGFNSPRVAVAPSLVGVMACIKTHESGDYQEHSHLQDGSGAFQFIPATWRAWSARAGHPGYPYAYLAPPTVQDAVVAYALTHGGAGNWSPRYGNDPCTVGMEH